MVFDQLVKTASAQYGLSFTGVEILHKTGRTLVLAMKSANGDYVLKSIFIDEKRLLFILDAERFLRAQGIRIPEIVPTSAGKPYFLWEGERYVLQEKLQGSPSPPISEESVISRAALLGQMHLSSLGFLSKHGPEYAQERTWIGTYLRELASIRRWANWYYDSKASKKQSILSYIDFFLKAGQEGVDRLQRSGAFQSWSKAPVNEHFLSHGDFHSDNVLTIGNHLYIIDWEFVGYNYPSKDIGRFVTGMMSRRKEWNFAWFQLLLGAYLQENPLNDFQLELLALDLSFPHNFYRFLDKGKYREMSPDDIHAFLQGEHDKTSYFLQLLNG